MSLLIHEQRDDSDREREIAWMEMESTRMERRLGCRER